MSEDNEERQDSEDEKPKKGKVHGDPVAMVQQSLNNGRKKGEDTL